MPESAKEAYERGKAEGQVEERLNGHEERLNKINGSMEKVADRLGLLTATVQQLGDEAKARESTVLTTAAALKAADDARRAAFQRTIGVIGAVCACVGAYAVFWS